MGGWVGVVLPGQYQLWQQRTAAAKHTSAPMPPAATSPVRTSSSCTHPTPPHPASINQPQMHKQYLQQTAAVLPPHPPRPTLRTCSNQPNVHEQKLLDNSGGWHGAELSVVIAGGQVGGGVLLLLPLRPPTSPQSLSSPLQLQLKQLELFPSFLQATGSTTVPRCSSTCSRLR